MLLDVPPHNQPKGQLEKNATFHIFTKNRHKNCKVIMDNGSCINAISSRLRGNLGLDVEPYRHPFKMSWIDSTTLEVKQRYLIPVNFNHYKDKISCYVITMNMGQVILGKP